MRHLTTDAACPQEATAQAAPADRELDRALARAIRRLIADVSDDRGDRDPVPAPAA